MAADADMTRVFDLTMRNDNKSRGLSLPGDTDRILDELVSAEIGFVFADPIVSMLDPRVDTWKDTAVRSAIESFVDGASSAGITMLGSLHTNKSNSTDPRQRGMGTAGWRQIPRAWFVIGLDPDDEEGKDGIARCIAHDKHNYGRKQKTVRFSLESKKVAVQGKTQEVVYADLGEECDVTAAQMLAAEAGVDTDTDERKGKIGKATALIERLLANGPVAVTSVKRAAADRGISWSTMERASKEIGVNKRQLEGVASAHVWEFPMDM